MTTTTERAQRGHVLVIEPDAAYAERFPDAPVEFRWSIECADTTVCGGFEECIKEHEVDGKSAADGPWECDLDDPWNEQDYFTFHGVEHQWHYGWNWTVPFEGCVVKANAEECPVWPMRPGRWQIRDEWESGGEYVTLHVVVELHSPPSAQTPEGTRYDDHDTSCPMCGVGLDRDALCDCAEPMCVRCHRAYQVEHGRSA